MMGGSWLGAVAARRRHRASCARAVPPRRRRRRGFRAAVDAVTRVCHPLVSSVVRKKCGCVGALNSRGMDKDAFSADPPRPLPPARQGRGGALPFSCWLAKSWQNHKTASSLSTEILEERYSMVYDESGRKPGFLLKIKFSMKERGLYFYE